MGVGMNRHSKEDFSGSEITLCDAAMVDTYWHTFVKTYTTPKSEP